MVLGASSEVLQKDEKVRRDQEKYDDFADHRGDRASSGFESGNP